MENQNKHTETHDAPTKKKPSHCALTYSPKQKVAKKEKGEHQKEKKKKYQHCSGGLSEIAINTNHSTGIGIELINIVRLLLKNLIVLPNKVCSHLNKQNPTSNFCKETKPKWANKKEIKET